MKNDDISLVKIDCEGCEYEIIRNTSDENIAKVNQFIFEIHLFDTKMEKELEVLKKRLKHLGFRLNIVPNPVHDYLLFLYAKKD